MNHYHATKTPTIIGLLLVLSLFSCDVFCLDEYHLYNSVKNIKGFKKDKNIRIGCVEIDVKTDEYTTDDIRFKVYDNYKFDMESFESLNEMFFLFSHYSCSTGEKFEEWNRVNAIIFLQLITDIFIENMQEFSNLDVGHRKSLIDMMVEHSNDFTVRHYSEDSKIIPVITMDSFIDDSSELAGKEYINTNNGMWLQILTFFIPFEIYKMATKENLMLDQVNRHFNDIASVFSKKRFHQESNNCEVFDPVRIITGNFCWELKRQDYELEFLYFLFMRSLSLAMSQIILDPRKKVGSRLVHLKVFFPIIFPLTFI